MLSTSLYQKKILSSTKIASLSMYNIEILKKCHSVIPCFYSVHDSSWVDFLRLTHSVDPQSIENVGNSYWSGDRVEDNQLLSMGQPWTQKPLIESLFIRRVEFYDRSLEH